MSEINIDILNMYGNPNSIQHTMLADMEARMGGGSILATPNNIPSVMVEGFANMSSNIVQDMINALEESHPKRALTISALTKHMSDYDYIGLFALPSDTNIELALNLTTLQNAPLVGGGVVPEHRIVVPRETIFTIGLFEFTLHYPILITINANTNSVTVEYDETVPNPLHSIGNKVLESRTSNFSGIDILSIKIPVTQLKRTVTTYDLYQATPFSKSLDYTSEFYAIRVYTNRVYNDGSSIAVSDGEEDWTEIGQTLSSEIYNPESIGPPTVIITVNQTSKEVLVTLPYVYISNDKIGSKIRIEMLSTEGVVDMNTTDIISTPVPTQFPLSGNVDIDKYTSMLTDTANINIGLLSNRITGGSLGMDIDTIRNRVIFDTFNDELLITPMDIEGYFGDLNYRVSIFKDGITSRIFLCHKELKDIKQAIIPSGDIPTVFDDTATIPGITKFLDGSFMAKPTTLYKYNPVTNLSTPVDTDDLNEFENDWSVEERVAALNDNTYTFNPFYTRLTVEKDIPLAYSYDMDQPKVNSIIFEEEYKGVAHMSVYDAVLTSDPELGQYYLTLEIKHSGGINETVFDDNHMIVVINTSDDSNGTNMYIEAAPQGPSEDASIFIFKATLPTSYHIIADDLLRMTFANGEGSVNLTSNISVGCYLIDTEDDMSGSITPVFFPTNNIPAYANYHIVSVNTVNVKFGEHLYKLFNAVDIIFDNKIIDLYTETTYKTWLTHNYTRVNGVVQYTAGPVLLIDNHAGTYVYASEDIGVSILPADIGDYLDKVKLDITDHTNDVVIDTTFIDAYVLADVTEVLDIGTREVEHLLGDPVINITNIDEVIASRNIKYRVYMTHINTRITFSNISNYANYVDKAAYITSLRTLIIDNCNTVTTMEGRLLPNTEVYFRPSRSIGVATFKVSSPTPESFGLEISVGIRLHVVRRAISDTNLQASITEAIIAIIDEHTTREVFSLTEIADVITDQFGDIVVSVDIDGINGNTSDQTLIHVDKGTILSLKHRLVIEEDGSIELKRAVDISFITADVASIA